MKQVITAALLFSYLVIFAQSTMSYTNEKGQLHYVGPISLPLPVTDTVWSGWEAEAQYALDVRPEWASVFEDVQVQVYLGTWCGDSKKWVPEFLALWNELGLSEDQLQLIGLYDGSEQYKQGPNREELGENIHRVPTFIFKRGDREIGRIVETPLNDLITDIAQIGLGVPSAPNFRTANAIMDLIEDKGLDAMRTEMNEMVYHWYDQVHKASELNTLGYVYLGANKMDEALTVFYLNTLFFPYDPNVWDSYAEAFSKSGDIEKAIYYYRKVLALDADRTEVQEKIDALLADNKDQSQGE
ncbi:MAG: hypothetical protein HRU40_20350 [Saprospiraceae bacterium]|nr:hypothetical protein [Saprospiraceae bacterium]